MPLKILLADDSMTAQKMGKEILTAAGYEVIAVSNGAVAAKKLADKPDIIILDIFMPGYSGLELCEKIRASMDLAKTPVLLTVGKMEPFRPEEVQRVKADGIIIKPFEATDLLAAVQKLAEKITAAAKPKATSGAYEKTMIFKAPQVIDEFKDDHEPEKSAEPAPMQMSSEAGSAPAFGADLMGEPASAPAFTETSYPTPSASAAPAADYSSSAPALEVNAPATETLNPAAPFDENVAIATRLLPGNKTPRKRNTAEIEAGAAIAAAAANAEPAFDVPDSPGELTSVESQTLESLLERTSEPVSHSSAPTQEMEFSATPSASEVEATPDPGLDRGYEESTGYGASGQDPALETDATKMASEFPTKFGTSEQEAGLEVSEPEATSAASSGDFDTRVADAMSGYDTGEAANTEVESDSAVPVVMSGYDTGEAASTETATSEIATSEAEAAAPPTDPAPPTYEDTQRIQVPVEDSLKVHAAEGAEHAQEIQTPIKAVEQIQASSDRAYSKRDTKPVEMPGAFASSPVESAPQKEQPVESTIEPTAHSVQEQPQASNVGLSSALAAAVGAEIAAGTPESPEASTSTVDHETTSNAVTRVLERMLPSIMAEVAREMEAAKKK